MNDALALLQTGVESFAACRRVDGELIDPVMGEPVQYGTPYHALCCAVLAVHGTNSRRAHFQSIAADMLDASLRHLEDTAATPNLSWLDKASGHRVYNDHRDFFWPAVLKTWSLLRDRGHEQANAFADRIRAIRVPDVFSKRPPGNWAAVWVSGEQRRRQLGLSDVSEAAFDGWIDTFFQTHIDVEAGFYHEPGHSNSYDLFTRYHLADLLTSGYTGAHRDRLETLLQTGLQRSLSVQLSDGSLASAHRSTGQTWTLGCQIAYFSIAARWFAERDPSLSDTAGAAARLAYASLRRFQRPDQPFSPVENCLPPADRVGYEGYSFDGNYSNLALGMLASAIHFSGFTADAAHVSALSRRRVFIEHDPLWRAMLHHDRFSVHLNAFPSPQYDGVGLVDLTFGPGRRFHFVSSAHPLSQPDRHLNLGPALLDHAGPGAGFQPLAQADLRLIDRIRSDHDAHLAMTFRMRGRPLTWNLEVRAESDTLHLTDTVRGHSGPLALLVPYLADAGTGHVTKVTIRGNQIDFQLDGEHVRLTLDGEASDILHLPAGFENRRGRCGLVRVTGSAPLRYSVQVVK